MIKRLICMFALAIAAGTTTMAQNVAMQKKEINSVKKNSAKYLYAEVTAKDKDEALALATEYLYEEINKYVESKKKLSKAPNIVTRNTKSSWETITMPRGNMYRAFVYVKKSDIIPADNASVTENTAATVIQSTVESITPYDETIGRLLQLQTFNELEPCIKQLKQEGRISDYNKYKTLERKQDYVLVIYNKDGRIEALLSEGESRTNLRTGQPDGVENYKGRVALGVKVNR